MANWPDWIRQFEFDPTYGYLIDPNYHPAVLADGHALIQGEQAGVLAGGLLQAGQAAAGVGADEDAVIGDWKGVAEALLCLQEA